MIAKVTKTACAAMNTVLRILTQLFSAWAEMKYINAPIAAIIRVGTKRVDVDVPTPMK